MRACITILLPNSANIFTSTCLKFCPFWPTYCKSSESRILFCCPKQCPSIFNCVTIGIPKNFSLPSPISCSNSNKSTSDIVLLTSKPETLPPSY